MSSAYLLNVLRFCVEEEDSRWISDVGMMIAGRRWVEVNESQSLMKCFILMHLSSFKYNIRK